MTYQKGKDIKQQGDCLVHCFIKKIECTGKSNNYTPRFTISTIPEEFDKW